MTDDSGIAEIDKTVALARIAQARYEEMGTQ